MERRRAGDLHDPYQPLPMSIRPAICRMYCHLCEIMHVYCRVRGVNFTSAISERDQR